MTEDLALYYNVVSDDPESGALVARALEMKRAGVGIALAKQYTLSDALDGNIPKHEKDAGYGKSLVVETTVAVIRLDAKGVIEETVHDWISDMFLLKYKFMLLVICPGMLGEVATNELMSSMSFFPRLNTRHARYIPGVIGYGDVIYETALDVVRKRIARRVRRAVKKSSTPPPPFGARVVGLLGQGSARPGG
jgi:hypothetical protein